MKEFRIASGPDIISRGFVYMRESEDLIKEAQKLVANHLDKVMERKTTQWSEIKTEITDTIDPFLYDKNKRRPIILPIIMVVSINQAKNNVNLILILNLFSFHIRVIFFISYFV